MGEFANLHGLLNTTAVVGLSMLGAVPQAKPENAAKKMIERHEGKRNEVYKDTVGVPTIGIGYNLNRSDARTKIKALGGNYDKIVSGKESLTDEQIYSLFDESFKESESVARSFSANFDDHPEEVRSVLVNMAFNLGPNRLAGFKKFSKALSAKDYKTAAKEMKSSRWYSQVGDRSKELVEIMSKAQVKPKPEPKPVEKKKSGTSEADLIRRLRE